VPQLDLSSVLEKSRSRGGVLSQSTVQHGKTPSGSILSPQQFSTIFKPKQEGQKHPENHSTAYGDFGQNQEDDKKAKHAT
jgi:hypothetical protein